MDNLDVNGTCKRPITNLKRHFCLWRNHTNAQMRESSYAIIKQPRDGNSKAKKINIKNNLLYRSYQAQLMGWMYLIIFTQTIHS